MIPPSAEVGTSLVVMGVSGVGKSTVAELFAQRTGLRFVDADDLHGAANIAKMSAGIPLTDEDRWPWLARVGAELAQHPPTVVACSALKRAYRDALRAQAPQTRFVLLSADATQIEAQVSARQGHFMPPALLRSQLAALEPLGDDEQGITIEVDAAPEVLVERVLRRCGIRVVHPHAS
ncbi:gluconokinase [Microbacterium aerolatum]|uniref:gluconokinase n=1 Tax=Microbacterium aerolatum TaxID=153731 RepID=UPI002001B73A|nr:gluconokinase [Microbacterium aerolatum]MCK3771073.1 gluconokinase [Microbacterium aerolatum]